MDSIAVSSRKALHILHDCGVVNELNVSDVYGRMIEEVKQPAQGYFYVTDVHDFGEMLIAELAGGVQ